MSQSRRSAAWRLAVVLATALHVAPLLAAGDSRLSEYQIKAGYLYNFAKFVVWPAESFSGPAAPFAICVFGEDPFGPLLDDVVRGRLVGKRTLLVRRPTQMKDLDGCQILFVGAATVSSFEEIRQRLKATSVLTVGESEWFTRDGGMIRFDVHEQRVGFEVNTPAATQVQLEISSQLLKVAIRAGERREP